MKKRRILSGEDPSDSGEPLMFGRCRRTIIGSDRCTEESKKRTWWQMPYLDTQWNWDISDYY